MIGEFKSAGYDSNVLPAVHTHGVLYWYCVLCAFVTKSKMYGRILHSGLHEFTVFFYTSSANVHDAYTAGTCVTTHVYTRVRRKRARARARSRIDEPGRTQGSRWCI